MNIQKRVKEEKVRDVDFTNSSDNWLVCYSNILNSGCDFLKDNTINDFRLLNYIDDSGNAKLFDNKSFL